MTVDRDVLATRIAKIRQELRHLSRLQDMSRADFLAPEIGFRSLPRRKRGE